MRCAPGIVIAACSVIPWSSAHATGPVSERAYTNYCTTGALHACASVIVKTAWSETVGATFVTVFVRNEQGSNWGYDNTGPSSLGHLRLMGLDPLTTATLPYGGAQIGAVGPVAVYGEDPSAWDWTLLNAYPSSDGTWRPYWSFDPAGNFLGIFGCDVPPIDPKVAGLWPLPLGVYAGGYGTCARDGWVTLRFATTTEFTADALWVTWSMGPGGNCDTQDRQSCAQVTPEPMTIVLLGTGLAGLGAVYRRRRRGGEPA